ncbi:MAG: L,D-transpeptidase [Thiotrichaceae bacterium]
MNVDLKEITQALSSFQSENLDGDYLLVSISDQTLFLVRDNNVSHEFSVSTAIKGVGSEEGSEKTPLGIHRIAEKIGKGAVYGSLFKARKNTHQVAAMCSDGEYSPIDAITTRILWLDGLELGKNKDSGEQWKVDSYQRYIYIHGTDEEWRLGKPASHGCIRMSNHAITKLYDKVYVNTLVVIIE